MRITYTKVKWGIVNSRSRGGKILDSPMTGRLYIYSRRKEAEADCNGGEQVVKVTLTYTIER